MSRLHFSFQGYGECWFSVDTEDFAGMDANAIAKELSQLAIDTEDLDYSDDWDQFRDAADQVFAALESGDESED